MDSKLPVDLLKCLKSGTIAVTENGKKSVEVKAKDKNIDVNLIDVSFNIPGKNGVLKKLSDARKFAKKLNDEELTLSISNKNKPVIKLGKKAKPTLSRMVTMSNSVEITDLRELRKLDKRLRIK